MSKECPECNSNDPVKLNFSYYDDRGNHDHMNAHLCQNKFHTIKFTGQKGWAIYYNNSWLGDRMEPVDKDHAHLWHYKKDAKDNLSEKLMPGARVFFIYK